MTVRTNRRIMVLKTEITNSNLAILSHKYVPAFEETNLEQQYIYIYIQQPRFQ